MYAYQLLNIVIIALVINTPRATCETHHQISHNDHTRLQEILSAPHLVQFIENIKFHYYNTDGTVKQSVFLNEKVTPSESCTTDQKFSVIIHGWRESCEVEWARLLVNNLIKYRGGCILCMDYSFYSSSGYRQLVPRFEKIVPILVGQLLSMTLDGFNPDFGYIFGFSFGARIASTAGQYYGVQKLKEIDLCDIAGPGFDYRSQHVNHSLAAQNVQCIQTSGDKGTRYSTCHQDWKMGVCGIMQAAASDPPLGSHGLCPYFYNAAFEYDFVAIDKPDQCSGYNEAENWPVKFKMGYMEDRKHLVRGELFAETTAEYPYTRHLDNKIETEILDFRSTTDDEYISRKRSSRKRMWIINARRRIRPRRLGEFY